MILAGLVKTCIFDGYYDWKLNIFIMFLCLLK